MKTVRRLAIVLAAVALLWLLSPLPVESQSVGDYFQISYEPLSFSKTEIHGGEVFYATIRGLATCLKDLPVAVDEASITSRVIASDAAGTARLSLNPSYEVTIRPFPSREGDTAQIDQVIPLQFPSQAESGDYDVIGEVVEARGQDWLWLARCHRLSSPGSTGGFSEVYCPGPSPFTNAAISTSAGASTAGLQYPLVGVVASSAGCHHDDSKHRPASSAPERVTQACTLAPQVTIGRFVTPGSRDWCDS